VLLAVPSRIIIGFVITFHFIKGKKFTVTRITYNRKASEEVLSAIYKQFLRDFFIKTDSAQPWPNDLLENSSLQKKMIEAIRTRTGLDVDPDVFRRCSTPVKLLDLISSCETKIVVKGPKGKKIEENVKRRKNPVLGFLANVPSEFYRLYNPRITLN